METFLTSCFSTCGERPYHGCHVCRPAHQGSQTCIWWPEEGRYLDTRCWTKSQTSRPQTSVMYPVENIKRDIILKCFCFSCEIACNIIMFCWQIRCTVSSDSHYDQKNKATERILNAGKRYRIWFGVPMVTKLLQKNI